MEYLARRVAEQQLRGPVPGTDLAAFSDGVRGVRGLLEQREQLRFEHRSPHDLPPEMLVLQAHVGQTGIRAQDARLSTRYERFIVAQGPRHNYALVVHAVTGTRHTQGDSSMNRLALSAL